MPEELSIDIDTKSDLLKANQIMKKRFEIYVLTKNR